MSVARRIRAAMRRRTWTVFSVGTVTDYQVTMGLVMLAVSGVSLGLAYGVCVPTDGTC
jgi:hypothetical protein